VIDTGIETATGVKAGTEDPKKGARKGAGAPKKGRARDGDGILITATVGVAGTKDYPGRRRREEGIEDRRREDLASADQESSISRRRLHEEAT
jgi:hypothetical protein